MAAILNATDGIYHSGVVGYGIYTMRQTHIFWGRRQGGSVFTAYLWGNLEFQRVIVLFPGYLPSPYWSPYWICTQHPTCQWSRTSICCHTSNPWNKCPKRGLMTTGGQIPIQKCYRSFHKLCRFVTSYFQVFEKVGAKPPTKTKQFPSKCKYNLLVIKGATIIID